MASKQPRRSDLTSDLKFMAQITYTAMFVWTVWTFFWTLTERKKKKEHHLSLLELSASPQLKISTQHSGVLLKKDLDSRVHWTLTRPSFTCHESRHSTLLKSRIDATRQGDICWSQFSRCLPTWSLNDRVGGGGPSSGQKETALFLALRIGADWHIDIKEWFIPTTKLKVVPDLGALFNRGHEVKSVHKIST